jgi:hypothetical protein
MTVSVTRPYYISVYYTVKHSNFNSPNPKLRNSLGNMTTKFGLTNNFK